MPIAITIAPTQTIGSVADRNTTMAMSANLIMYLVYGMSSGQLITGRTFCRSEQESEKRFRPYVLRRPLHFRLSLGQAGSSSHLEVLSRCLGLRR